MPDATFDAPDLTTFARLDELGLVVAGQRLEPDRAVLECRVVARDDDAFCRRCGAEGVPRGTVTRRLAHEPFGWRPTTLLVRVRRYRCATCLRVWRQDTSTAAEPRAKLSRAAVRWALTSLVIQHLKVRHRAEHGLRRVAHVFVHRDGFIHEDMQPAARRPARIGHVRKRFGRDHDRLNALGRHQRVEACLQLLGHPRVREGRREHKLRRGEVLLDLRDGLLAGALKLDHPREHGAGAAQRGEVDASRVRPAADEQHPGRTPLCDLQSGHVVRGSQSLSRHRVTPRRSSNACRSRRTPVSSSDRGWLPTPSRRELE
ncbi:Transposase and inactivated derivatives [Kytococcus sedentarius]|nr:Transposase and inactivated derivatives [Kytococcus sedentarius]